MDFLTPEQGKLGLPNVGNSCYLNSTIQCLAGTPELVSYFFQSIKNDNGQSIRRYKIDMSNVKTVKNNKTNSKKSLMDAWYNLLVQLWGTRDKGRVNPIPFYRLIGQVANESNVSISVSGGQNDFQEFLILLMDSLHDVLSYETKMNIVGTEMNHMDKLSVMAYTNYIKHFEKDYSIFVKLFTGQISTITVGECGHESVIFDPIKFLHLIIPPSQETLTITDLFENYIKESYLTIYKNQAGEIIDERWYCDKCNDKVNAKTKNSIWELPKYLIITLGRYQYFPRPCKINTKVVYPLENLDMNKFHSGFKNEPLKYNLYAVSNHFGNQSGGHYTAYRKNPDNKWYSFNDETVGEINNPEDIVVSNSAYCLFYERTKK
jgi:ubiquitin C-terminal hydrolase